MPRVLTFLRHRQLAASSAAHQAFNLSAGRFPNAFHATIYNPSRGVAGPRERVLHDFYSKEAKRLGYAARSAFKLQEIQKRFNVIPKGGSVLDLGCHPGAWLQVVCQSLGPSQAGGAVLGVDLQETAMPEKMCDYRVSIWQADARELKLRALRDFQPKGFHTVLSDMCPATAGNSTLDALQSLALQEVALGIAVGGDCRPQDSGGACGDPLQAGVLRPGGNIVMKLLEGTGSREFGAALKQRFKRVAWFRPKATRSESKEIFLVGRGYLGHVTRDPSS
mmetsp:Transcript_26562/g.68828  ORF Transcript_26562/g.68828 Transcript_26562/m.68828 type:complete len:278 (-) Transcript_26562:201-1034(-)